MPAMKPRGFLNSMIARLIALLIVVLGVALFVWTNESTVEGWMDPSDPALAACMDEKVKELIAQHPEGDPLTEFDRKLYEQRAETDCIT